MPEAIDEYGLKTAVNNPYITPKPVPKIEPAKSAVVISYKGDEWEALDNALNSAISHNTNFMPFVPISSSPIDSVIRAAANIYTSILNGTLPPSGTLKNAEEEGFVNPPYTPVIDTRDPYAPNPSTGVQYVSQVQQSEIPKAPTIIKRQVITTVTNYVYIFGLDKVNVIKKNINKTCCFISNDIHIGNTKEGEYLQLEVDCSSNESSSIEFSIIENQNINPIFPINQNYVSNEKIFYGLNTRFSIDKTKPVQIKRNGSLVDLDIDKVIKLNDAEYTVSYMPMNATNHMVYSNTIKIKIVQRLYDINKELPTVKSVTIKKFGGDTLWTQNI